MWQPPCDPLFVVQLGLLMSHVPLVCNDTMWWYYSLEVYKEQAAGQPPTVRGYHSFDALAHKCCVVGGRRGGELLMDKEQFVCVYDAAAKQWLPPVHLPNLPTPRTSHGSLVVSRNQLLICGGTASYKQRLDNTHVLKIESKRMSWSRVRIPPLPTGLRSCQHVWLVPGFTAESKTC